ncbi:MAG: hypothetical protein ACLFVU_03595 [Phycisphaerae bacterium]
MTKMSKEEHPSPPMGGANPAAPKANLHEAISRLGLQCPGDIAPAVPDLVPQPVSPTPEASLPIAPQPVENKPGKPKQQKKKQYPALQRLLKQRFSIGDGPQPDTDDA